MNMIPTDEECRKLKKEEDLVHELTKKILPIMDFLATVGGVAIWVWTGNFTWGAIVWLFAEAWRIQINQKKIIDMLKEMKKGDATCQK